MLRSLLVLVAVGCSFAAEVCWPPCGCFQDDAPFDDRPLPENPSSIRWLLYTTSNRFNPREITLDNVNNPPSEFDPNRPTKFMIHGWNSSPNTFTDLRNAFLDNMDYNLIMVDWSTLAGRVNYVQSASNTRVTGACTEYISRQLTTNHLNVHCIGHSLGGQTCGYMGKTRNGLIGAQIGRITGLDPAGPWFPENDPRIRLDATDTDFMDNVHTNGEGASLGLGASVGHIDFFPNKGGRQPGCSNGNCDHSICKDFYTASITHRSGSCQFASNPCNSAADADAGNCESCLGSNPSSSCGRMGYYADEYPASSGSQYLRTVASHPYCAS